MNVLGFVEQNVSILLTTWIKILIKPYYSYFQSNYAISATKLILDIEIGITLPILEQYMYTYFDEKRKCNFFQLTPLRLRSLSWRGTQLKYCAHIGWLWLRGWRFDKLFELTIDYVIFKVRTKSTISRHPNVSNNFTTSLFVSRFWTRVT